MRINHNIAALNTYRQLNSANGAQGKSMEKLSSGLRINRAGDDAAGLAISEKMRGQVRGLEQASRNSQDGISMIQTAEGALNETHSILQRMRELAVQAGNDTNTATDRGEIQKEVNQLTSEINRIGNTTEFNTQKLIDGTKTTAAAGAADQVAFAGYTFDTNGADLNGYTFVTGTVADGTTEAAVVDTTAKTITISGDFTSTGFSTAANLQAAINTALSGQGITQTVTVGGTGAATTTAQTSAAIANGTAATSGATLQIGANENQSLTVDFADMRSLALGLTGTAGAAGFTATNTVTDGTNNSTVEAALDVSTATNAASAITAINAAIELVSAERSKLGSNQNRLEHTINNLGTSAENLTAAESRIRDVDYALAA